MCVHSGRVPPTLDELGWSVPTIATNDQKPTEAKSRDVRLAFVGGSPSFMNSDNFAIGTAWTILPGAGARAWPRGSYFRAHVGTNAMPIADAQFDTWPARHLVSHDRRSWDLTGDRGAARAPRD